MTTWHHTDAAGEQRGPLTAEEVREAVARGEIPANARFWRYGLADWVDLATVADELGLPPPATGQDPYVAPASFATSPPTGDEAVPAGFVRRFLALLLDQLILGVPAFALLMLIGGASAALASGGGGDAAGFLVLAMYPLYYVMAGLYYAGQESSRHQATLGKRALGIKVTDTQGRRLTFGHALGRWFAAALSYMTAYVGFLMAAFTDQRRALHDLVAGTLVVDQWAYTDHPERQKRELGGCLVVGVVGLVLIVPILAILAAIAIPSFQDYTLKAQTSEAIRIVDGIKPQVAGYRANNGAFPASNAQASLPEPAEYGGQYVGSVAIIDGGRLVATFSSTSPQGAHVRLDGQSLVFTPTMLADGDTVEWQCTSDTLDQSQCPASCACQ